MQEKKIYLILLPAILVFLGIILFLAFSGVLRPKEIQEVVSGDGKPTNIGEEQVVKTPTAAQSSSGDFLRLAEETKDASKCLGFTDERYAAACAAEIGRQMQDAKACSVIDNQMEMMKCVDMVAFDKAIKGGEVKDCMNIDDDGLADSCVVNLVDMKSLTIESCQVLPERERNSCKSHIDYLYEVNAAKNATKVDDCGPISNESAKAYCLDKFPPK